MQPASASHSPPVAESSKSTSRINTPGKLVAVAIVAISAGLCVPLYLARRQAASSIVKTASSVASPPSIASDPARLLGRHAVAPTRQQAAAITPVALASRQKQIEQISDTLEFNPGLYTFSAFGAATLMVWTTAAVGVYGVHRLTGATTLEEFAQQSRTFVHQRLPWLRNKLYPPTEHVEPLPGTWSWDDAERRLEDAYEEGGITRWLTQTVQEMHAESEAARGRVERDVQGSASNG